MTGLDSAHLAQGHSAAGENETVSQNRQLAQFNCPLLTKDWIICRSCVTCRIHTRPVDSPQSFDSLPSPFSSPVHYVIRSVMVEQDRCVSRLQGLILVKPPWFLPSPSVLWSGISPLG